MNLKRMVRDIGRERSRMIADLAEICRPAPPLKAKTAAKRRRGQHAGPHAWRRFGAAKPYRWKPAA